ncbi:NCS2 family permease [Phocicoccus pinnipedialis]|uniref:Guanine/hypoxanthine permease PbuG n=1 Tax=Phocicoccus pinnipedialis TaxID=110845 RepID=A0A6V7R606_9BACL|nr:NCS2 family permease [Jeotgalicoccus pinnipedialis]MBP1939810.1 AGZA family xanthine/uracil permease-like MFS transporter [Jeotgalicoccus pinnipedialis]CAD2072458.1 Guanine/hypoxanthine permease PbuG [Jeotgalicoccus pinnipedialis]
MRKYFEFEQLGTNYRKETIGGITTFLSMAYILAVNPAMLSLAGVDGVPDSMRMDINAVFVATCLAAFVGTLIMGVYARYPIALAPGMGLNAFFAFAVVLGMGIPWQTGLTGVLVSGVLFVILTASGLREYVINSIPMEMKMAVSAGIGFFIAFVGLQGAGIIVADQNTLVSVGDFHDSSVLLAVFGIVLTVVLMAKRVPAAIFIGMIMTAIAGLIFGLLPMPEAIVSKVPSIAPTFGAAFEAFRNPTEIFNLQFLVVVLTFLFVDFFDTAGTLVGVASQANLIKDNKLPRAGRALVSDSIATITGAIFGTSTTTSYVESTAGVAAGARSGFASVVTAFLFLLAIFFSPLIVMFTSEVTAPALIIVGALMASNLSRIEWSRFEIAVPAFLTVLLMPLTYSIATGIAIGFIFYPITLMMAGKKKQVNPVMWVLAIIFVLYFIFIL